MSFASSGKQTVRYRYDALGRRIQRNTNRGGVDNTKFIYDGLDVLVDDNSGILTKYQNGLGIDDKLSVKVGADVKYFLSDHLGSTNGLADASGSLTSQTAYDAFGNQTASLTTRYGFTGRERDDVTGLMYYRARFYDANLGRFISEDPIGFASGDNNHYAYVNNSPMRFIDPLGLDDADRIWDEQFKDRYWGFSGYELSQQPFLRCGPRPDNPFEWLVPDRIGGRLGYFGSTFDFQPACVQHDICYGRCGVSQEECDLNLRQNIKKECESGGPERDPYRSQCHGYAETYYRAVSDRWWLGRNIWDFGKRAYVSAQEGSGCNDCESNK